MKLYETLDIQKYLSTYLNANMFPALPSRGAGAGAENAEKFKFGSVPNLKPELACGAATGGKAAVEPKAGITGGATAGG